MNHAKLYAKAIGEEPKPAPVEHKDIKAISSHNTWLQHPHTAEFLKVLSQEMEALRDRATTLACTNPSSSEIIKALISAKQLEKVLTYARSNESNN